MGYTPGPWEIESGNKSMHHSVIRGAEREHVADTSPNWLHSDPLEMSRANAQLIAAAPELLDACQDALVCSQEGGLTDLVIKRIQQAITKATA